MNKIFLHNLKIRPHNFNIHFPSTKIRATIQKIIPRINQSYTTYHNIASRWYKMSATSIKRCSRPDKSNARANKTLFRPRQPFAVRHIYYPHKATLQSKGSKRACQPLRTRHTLITSCFVR